MDIAASVGDSLLRAIDFIKPEVGDDFSGKIIDEPGIRITSVGIRLDAPVATGNIFRHGI